MSDATLLPPNATALERALEAVAAARLGAIGLTFADLWSAERCPAHLLGHLAWSLSVDLWDEAWSEAVKREVCARSIAVHRRKGSAASVRDLLAAAGYGAAEVTEGPTLARAGMGQRAGAGLRAHGLTHWAQYRVRTTAPITRRAAELLARLLAQVVPVRSRLARVTSAVGIAAGEDRAAGPDWTAGATVEITLEAIA
ncbi:MAG: phage tail protein I [Paracoccaceae bacterium]